MHTHDHNHKTGQSNCNCCGMSRRCFLASSAAAASAPLVGAAASGAEDLGEYIDLESFRPKPKVRIMSCVIRLKPPYWLGWPGTAYDVEGFRKKYAREFDESAERVGVQIEREREPLESDEAVAAYVKKLKAEKPDAVLITMQHLSTWKWADAVAKAGLPTIVFSPVGTSFTHHTREISRRPGVYVISTLDTSAVEQAMKMIRAKRQLEQTRVLVLRGEDRNETVLERLGTKIRYAPRRLLHELFEKMPENDETREIADKMMKHAKDIVEPDRQDVLNAARSFQTAKRLLHDEKSNAITTDCLGMVTSKLVPTPPCMAATMFQDAGVTYGCEADLFAAISLLFVSYVFDRPGFQNDPVAETVANRLIVAHCTCGTRLNGFDEPQEPYVLRSHSESDIGVATQILWKVGQPVTLVRFQDPNSLILDTGTVVGNVQTPPAGGCRTSVEVEMDRVRDSRDVLGFHQAVFYGNWRREVEAFAQLYGIKVINSPETPPKRKV